MDDLLERRKEIEDYFQKMMVSCEHNANGLRSMKDRGYSDNGMIEMLIEVTAIQSNQIKNLASVCLAYVKSEEFTRNLAYSMVMEHEENKAK